MPELVSSMIKITLQQLCACNELKLRKSFTPVGLKAVIVLQNKIAFLSESLKRYKKHGL